MRGYIHYTSVTLFMHLDFYRKNARYAETLQHSDPRQFQALPRVGAGRPFHEKYVRELSRDISPGAKVLDVGAGVGQAVHALATLGFDAHGVDVSETNLEWARQGPGTFHLYDGVRLPFAHEEFASVGAFNVLEHVADPVSFLDEMARVLQPGGRMVVSSPNFLRVLGWRDYHPYMQGLRQKWRNAKTLRLHRREYESGKPVSFETMAPITREPMRPDDDAITATNALDLYHYFCLKSFIRPDVSCVDRPVPRWLEFLLDATPLRYIMLNCFITAIKPALDQR